MAVSAAFCTETKTGHPDGSSMQCSLRPQSVTVLNVEHFFVDFLLPAVTHNCLRTNRRATFAHLSRTLPVSSDFNYPADSVSRWCNTNTKLSTILSLLSNKRTTRKIKGFDNGLTSCYSLQCRQRQQISQVFRTICEKLSIIAFNNKEVIQMLKCQVVRKHSVICTSLHNITNHSLPSSTSTCMLTCPFLLPSEPHSFTCDWNKSLLLRVGIVCV
jgi:hypothetical protein